MLIKPLFQRLDSDRAALLACLSLPLVGAIIAFIIAIALTGFSMPEPGSSGAKIAGLAYVYLTLCVMCLPAYCAGLAWLWWATRDDDERLMVRLYTMPIIIGLCIWFPSLAFIGAPMAERAKMFPVFAFTTIVGGYIWVGIVRLMFYAWRRK